MPDPSAGEGDDQRVTGRVVADPPDELHAAAARRRRDGDLAREACRARRVGVAPGRGAHDDDHAGEGTRSAVAAAVLAGGPGRVGGLRGVILAAAVVGGLRASWSPPPEEPLPEPEPDPDPSPEPDPDPSPEPEPDPEPESLPEPEPDPPPWSSVPSGSAPGRLGCLGRLGAVRGVGRRGRRRHEGRRGTRREPGRRGRRRRAAGSRRGRRRVLVEQPEGTGRDDAGAARREDDHEHERERLHPRRRREAAAEGRRGRRPGSRPGTPPRTRRGARCRRR